MARALLVLLPPLLACAWLGLRPARCPEAPQTPDWRMTLKTIRNGVHKIDMYLNAALDLLGGEDGLCQYKCSDGEAGGGAAAIPALPPAGSLQAARPAQTGRGCEGGRLAAALPPVPAAAPGATGRRGNLGSCLEAAPPSPPAAAEGCQAGDAPGEGFLARLFSGAAGAPRIGRFTWILSVSLGWLGLPRRTGWDCWLGREMGLVVAPRLAPQERPGHPGVSPLCYDMHISNTFFLRHYF